MTAKKRLAILISGRGSNMEALLRAAQADADWPAQPVLVLANKAGAPGLERARSYGVATATVESKAFPKDRQGFEQAMQAELEKHEVELIALAGFMRILTPWFIDRWTGRLINIHPSLLPKYPGVDTHQRALDAGDRVHGCTVHHVIAGVDEGPMIGQAEIDVEAGDTADTLAARVLKAEHLLYPRCLAAIARGTGVPVREKIMVDGDMVRLYAPT